MDARLTAIEGDLASLKVRNAVDEVHRKNVETRLTSIEDTLKWLVRIVIGGILAAAVMFVVSGGMAV